MEWKDCIGTERHTGKLILGDKVSYLETNYASMTNTQACEYFILRARRTCFSSCFWSNRYTLERIIQMKDGKTTQTLETQLLFEITILYKFSTCFRSLKQPFSGSLHNLSIQTGSLSTVTRYTNCILARTVHERYS